MGRKLRVQYPGAIYHVMNRGDRREPIFDDDLDRQRFLQTLGEACAKTDWQVHAWCLMGNHFHLVIETPQPNLVVDGSGNGYLKTVCDYVHLNPVRAKLLRSEAPLRAFRWSSFAEYVRAPARRPPWLRVGRLFGEMGIAQDTSAGRRQFELRMEERRAQETGRDWRAIRRGWCLGDEGFRRELLQQIDGRMGEHHYGEERRESAEEKAQRLVAEGLRKARWTEADLRRRRKSDPVKIGLAVQLRRETTMTLKWIAERLQMGAWTHLNKRLYERRKEGGGRNVE